LAKQAVGIVKAQSELKDLWESDLTEWMSAVEDLDTRLTGSGETNLEEEKPSK